MFCRMTTFVGLRLLHVASLALVSSAALSNEFDINPQGSLAHSTMAQQFLDDENLDGLIRQRDVLVKEPLVLQRHHESHVIMVKFHDNLPIRLRDGLPDDLGSGVLQSARATLDLFDTGHWTRIWQQTEEDTDSTRHRAERALGRGVADFNVWYLLQLPEHIDAASAIELLNLLDVVELAHPVSRPAPLPASSQPMGSLPNLQPDQGYLWSAPTGVDAYYAWNSLGLRGEAVRIFNLEYGYNSLHVDLPSITKIGPPHSSTSAQTAHGTMVMGVLFSIQNGWGTTGIATGSSKYFVGTNAAWSWGDHVLCVACAISVAVNAAQSGDVILIEQQSFGPLYDHDVGGQYGMVPVEWEFANYEAILMAVGNGIVVVEPAGNGQQNLDAPIYSVGNGNHWPFLSWNDSGAIMVGGGSASDEFGGMEPARSRRPTSNYGSRINVQGWGQRVATTGCLPPAAPCTPGSAYSIDFTKNFGGTSGASAIVAGVSALIQSHVKNASNKFLTLNSQKMRQVLVNTGTPQTGDDPSSEHIGPLPNIQAAVTSMPVWVDFAHPGEWQFGNETFPYMSLGVAANVAPAGGSIFVRSSSSGETGVLSKALTLTAVNGSVLIGKPGICSGYCGRSPPGSNCSCDSQCATRANCCEGVCGDCPSNPACQ